MIDASKLMIGNCLQDKKGRECQVMKIIKNYSYQDVEAPAIKGAITSLPNKPMLISEDWVIKLGFEKENLSDNSGYFYTLKLIEDDKCDLYLSSGDKNGYIEVVLSPYEEYFRFKYVHEVQNVYKVLTGKDLIS